MKVDKFDANWEQKQFRLLDFVRFPAIVMVVFIHSSRANGAWYANLISDHLCTVAVPTFFFISGFLFFHKMERWNWQAYGEKLKRRFYSLMLPFFFLNMCYLVFFGAIQSRPGFSPPDGLVMIRDYSLGNYLDVLGITGNGLDYPLWFVKSLMVLCLASPFIFWGVTKFGWLFLVIFAGLMGWHHAELPLFSVHFSDIFFFSSGALLALRKQNLVIKLQQWRLFLGTAYLITLVLAIEISPLWHWLNLIAGVPFFLFCMSLLSPEIIGKKMIFFQNSVFFIYCSHSIVILYVLKILSAIGAKPLIVYFASPIITVLILMGAYLVIEKFFPIWFRLLFTGRKEKVKG